MFLPFLNTSNLEPRTSNMSSASSSTAPTSAPANSFATMPEAEIKDLLRRLNVSRPELADLVEIKQGTFKRWMRLDDARFDSSNLAQLRNWLSRHSLADLQQLHSRNYSREVHAEVRAEVEQGNVTPKKFQRLKRKCETAQEDSMPSPSKPKISKVQIRRIVRTRETESN